jgi:hypothetical protein
MRKLLFKRILPGSIVLLALTLGGVYGLLRSESFIKNQVLPRLSKQLGQPVSAERVQIHPFSGLLLQGLRFNCEGEAAACPPERSFSLRAGSLELQYDFAALFSRRIHITSLRANDLHIGVTTGLDSSQSTPAPAETAPSQPEPSTSTSGAPFFTFRVSDAILDRSSFTLTSKGAPDSYRFDQITIKIPEADSHQDGTISISTRATIRSAALTIDTQPLTLAAKLRDSKLFMPTTLDVDLSAGQSSPSPVEIKGTLAFSQEPYELTKVTLQKGLVRQSLLQILAIPFAPLQEFEYALDGDYTLASPASANINVGVQKNVFIGGGNHDLKGSAVSSKLQIASDKISISDAKVSVVDNSAPILTSSLSGAVSFKPYTAPSAIVLNASLVDADRIRTLLNEINPQPSSPDEKDAKVQKPAETAPSQTQSSPAPLQIPIGSLDVRVDKVVVQGIETNSFVVGVKVPNSRTIEKASLDATFPQGGTLSMNASGSLDTTLTFKASGKDVNMIPFAAAASGPKGEILEGSLKALDVNIAADAKEIRKTLQGHATVSLSRLIVPSTLQEQVPFNILFLPLDALITVFGGTLNMLLPASISSISDSIRQTLDDAGRLGIDNSIVDLRFEKGKILLKNVDINTKNLPDFTFKGNITPEDRLDLTVFIALLKLNLPLPIAGTMSTPLPDVMYLGPELVRGLGLSIGSIAGSAASVFGGGAAKGVSGPQGSNEAPVPVNTKQDTKQPPKKGL